MGSCLPVVRRASDEPAPIAARQGGRPFAGLEEKLPDLADRVAFSRARTHEIMGESRAAAAAYGSVKMGSIVWAQAQLAQGRALQRAGDRTAALDAVATILSLPAPEDLTRGDPASEALLLTGRLRAAG